MKTALAVLLLTLMGVTAPTIGTVPTGSTHLADQMFGTGPVIVLLAGGPGMNPAYIVPVAKLLSADGRQVVLLHQRGTGLSTPAAADKARLTLAGAINDLEALRKALHLKKLTIAGHSWGGMLAMAYAKAHADRVAGLLLIDSGPMSSADFARENAVEASRLSAKDRADISAAKRANDHLRLDALQEIPDFADRANIEKIAQSIPAGEPLGSNTVGEAIGRDLNRFDVRKGMRALRAPVAMVFGAHDPGFFVAGQIQHIHTGARLTVVPKAGHYPWFENSAATAAALKSSLQSLP